jgi:hypothetical protein
MKKLFLSAIFAVLAFASNSQVVTITGFGLSQANGPVLVKNDFTEILLDHEFRYTLDDQAPFSYKYVVDFNTKQCNLFDGDGVLVAAVRFKVINKNSDRDFQIEIFGDEDEDQYGIVVKDTEAAYFQYNGKAVSLFIFDALYIY